MVPYLLSSAAGGRLRGHWMAICRHKLQNIPVHTASRVQVRPETSDRQRVGRYARLLPPPTCRNIASILRLQNLFLRFRHQRIHSDCLPPIQIVDPRLAPPAHRAPTPTEHTSILSSPARSQPHRLALQRKAQMIIVHSRSELGRLYKEQLVKDRPRKPSVFIFGKILFPMTRKSTTACITSTYPRQRRFWRANMGITWSSFGLWRVASYKVP